MAFLKSWRHRAFLLFLLAVLGARCGPGSREPSRSAAAMGPPPPAPAGVVLILVDTLRADHVGVYGSALGLTPTLDAVAARGVVFENAVAPSSWTRATIASVFTSHYPTSIGVLGRDDAIAAEVTTLPEILRGRGGFDTLGIITNNNAGRQFGFAQGFDRFEVPDLKAGYPGDFKIHVAEGVTTKALRFLDDVDGARARRPFFLYLLYVDPHDPYLPHQGLLPTAEPDGRFDGSRRQLQILDGMPAEQVTAADRDRIRYLYAGEVKYCDYWIGELLRGLEERGLADEVLLIVSADHGEGLWDHGFRAHGRDLYDEMVHVPLIVRFPASWQIPAPLRIAAPVSLLDVAPTILSAYGIPAPEGFWGADLMPLLRGESRPRRREFIYTEMDLDGRTFEAIRHRDSKLIRDRRGARARGLELYDLAADADETHNLADESPRELERLRTALDDLSGAVAADVTTSDHVPPEALDAETVESLRALGYLGGGGPLPRRPTRGPETELAPVLDFSAPDHAVDQLLSGFYETEAGARWMGGRASVVLGRAAAARAWRIEGWIDLALHGRDELTLTVRADRGEPQKRTIDTSGSFVLEGRLAASEQPSVQLDIECDHDFVPAEQGNGVDERVLCVIVSSIGLV